MKTVLESKLAGLTRDNNRVRQDLLLVEDWVGIEIEDYRSWAWNYLDKIERLESLISRLENNIE